jgi:hypothetical protein
VWFLLRAKPKKKTTSPPFARAKRAQSLSSQVIAVIL